MEPIISEAVPRKNRLLVCPECGGKLSCDRDMYTTEQGVAFRERTCGVCGAIIYSRQEPEEITGIRRDGRQVWPEDRREP